MILVDTSVWIDYFNGFPSPEAKWLYQAISEDRPIIVPGLILAEILCGLKGDADAERVESILTGFETSPLLEWEDYVRGATIYRLCRSQGLTPRSLIDCLLTSLCLRYGYSLLSLDRDFLSISRVVDLNLLKVSD